MFPFCYEWAWDMSHIVFMGGLWYALGILGAGISYVAAKSAWDTLRPSDGHEHGHH